MTRRCSHCSHNGHNSRTCPNRGVKLFGVRLTDGPIRKSASMGNLSHYAGLQLNSSASPGDPPLDHGAANEGYASEDCVPGSSSSSRERKKGTPWTEEEHRMFLLGLQKLGKGDWRGIARSFVPTRTPTQVASHAQKYFIRQSNVSRRKRRSSLFDIVADEGGEERMDLQDPHDHFFTPKQSHPETQCNSLPPPAPQEQTCESMELAANTNNADSTIVPPRPETSQPYYPMLYPAYFPVAFPMWIGPANNNQQVHEVLKPQAVHVKNPINVDELGGMSKLSLGAPSLSLTLCNGSSRQSAFHAKAAAPGGSPINSSGSPVPAAL